MQKLEVNYLQTLQDNCERASEVMRSLGNKWRMLVVCQLAFGEKTVSELERVTGLTQSTLSQHLMVLRHRDLVAARRSAQNVYYSLSSPVVADILRTLHAHFCEAIGGHRSTRPPRLGGAPKDGMRRESGRWSRVA